MFLRSCSFLIPAALATCLGLPGVTSAQSFQLLGLPPGTGGSYAAGVSYDGSVVAGASFFSGSGNYGPGWFWTAQGGRQDLVGPGFQPNSNGYGISGDGNFVVGETGPSQYDSPAAAYRYNRSTQQVQLLGVQPGYARSRGMAASLDGSVVVGKSFQSESSNFAQAFRWTQAGGLQPLGFTRPGLHNHSEATAVSADGLVVTGFSAGPSGADAFLWTATTGLTILPPRPGAVTSAAHGINSTATIIVGQSGTQRRAAMWQNGSVFDLGVPAGYIRSQANGVSDDGSVIVGQIDNGGLSTFTAAIWFPGTGWQSLEPYLLSIGVTVPNGINLYEATGISRDGRMIIGYTSVFNNTQQAFVVTIPGPGTTALFGVVLAFPRRPRRCGGATQVS